MGIVCALLLPLIYLLSPGSFNHFRANSVGEFVFYTSIALCGCTPILLALVSLRRSSRLKVGGWRNAVFSMVLGAANCLFIPFGSMYLTQRSNWENGMGHSWVRCEIHMHSIGGGILIYRNEHAGQYPDSLDQLFLAGDVDADSFVCPLSGINCAPPGSASLNGATSYVYLGKGLRGPVSGNFIVLYESPKNHVEYSNDVNFLYGDGHVAAMKRSRAEAVIKQLEAGVNPPK